MTDETLARLATEAEIRRTFAEYCHKIDDGDFDALGECFTEQAELVAFGRTKTGRPDVTAFLAKVMRPEARGKHLMANVIVTHAGDGRASSVSDFLFIGPDRSLVPGRYLDELAHENGRWRLARREIV
jgi:3-phenylpropionate/cinnamic acid dioxygenase small subunit